MVIPTRNRRPLLERSLTCALRQRDVRVEVVVVDDASDDDTPAYLATMDDVPVSVLRQAAPTGVAAARNAGLAAARSPWVAFLDDDDLWAPDRLRAQLDELERRPEAGWACSGAVVVDAALGIVGAQRPPAPESLPASVLRYNVVPGGASGVLAATSLVRRLGGFDLGLRILADWDLWIRLALAAPVARVERPHVAYVLHGGNMTSTPTGFADELEIVRRAYEAPRARYGVELNEAGWSDWFAELERRRGRRLAPGRSLVRRGISQRSPRLVLRGVSMAFRPGWVERRNRFRREHMDPAWRAEAEAWLAALGETGDGADEST